MMKFTIEHQSTIIKVKGIENPQTTVEGECPQNCGLCLEHESHTYPSLVYVTNRCMKCPVCFMNAVV